MTKNELIEKLQSIKGNPQITVWNGMVGDYHHIGNVDELFLYKEDVNFRLEGIAYQRQRDNRPAMTEEDIAEFKKDHKKQGYEFPNQFLEEDQYKVWYGKNKKRIICIEPKPRGKSTWDRMGDINY